MIRITLLAIICVSSSLFAANASLVIGTESFAPPFVMQGSNNKIYGFDIDMMSKLCQIINKTCIFKIMPFEQLLPAVAAKKIDAAISSITITPERATTVNFSLPYLVSYSRFLERTSSNTNKFTLANLNNKTIGLEKGTIFLEELHTLRIKTANIKEYPDVDSQLAALSNNEIDIIILDNPTAVYWASNSSNTFQLAGPRYVYGFGLGIAINKTEVDLLREINRALLEYQNSNAFKLNYNKYLAGLG